MIVDLLQRAQPQQTEDRTVRLSDLGIGWRGMSFGAGVNAESLLTVTAAQACVSLISGQLASLPLIARTRADGLPLPVQPMWLRKPDPEMTRADVLSQVAVSLLTDGNAYLYIPDRLADGQPATMKALDPQEVAVSRSPEQRLVYQVNGSPVRTDDVVHIRALTLPGADLGCGPLTYGSRLLRTAFAEEQYAAARFSEDASVGAGVPDGVVETDQMMDPEQVNEFAESWHQAVGGTRRGIPVLHSGLKFRAVELSAEAMQFVASRQWTAQLVCAAFGVAPYMIGMPTEHSMTYSNVQQVTTGFVRFGLRSLAARIEAAFSDLLPSTQVTTFEYGELQRPDIADRYELHRTAIAAGFKTVDEVRAEEGLPPLRNAPAGLQSDTDDDTEVNALQRDLKQSR